MKRNNFLYVLLLMVATAMMSVSFSSCSQDDPEPEPTPEPEYISLADQAAGVYVGQLKTGNTLLSDAYAVTVKKLNSSSVKVEADFLGSGENFTLSKGNNGQINFSNATHNTITMYVVGTTLSVSFVNGAGSMTTFVGSK